MFFLIRCVIFEFKDKSFHTKNDSERRRKTYVEYSIKIFNVSFNNKNFYNFSTEKSSCFWIDISLFTFIKQLNI